MTRTEMNRKLMELMILEAQKKMLESQIEAIKDEVKADMTAAGLDEFGTDDFTVYWKTSARTTLDSKKLKKEAPTLWAAYSRTSNTQTFKVVENERAS